MYEFEKIRQMYHEQVKQFPLAFIGNNCGNEIVGWGAVKMTGVQCKESDISNALLVTTGLAGTGIVEEVQGICTYAGVETTLFKVGQTNPRLEDVYRGVEAYRDADCNGILSVGGGSSHDTGKMIRMVLANPKLDLRTVRLERDNPATEFMSTLNPLTVPQVSVNTTAGTGAEMTGFAVVTDWEAHWKFNVIAGNMVPTFGITDPAVLRCMPQHLAAATGLDAFIHGQGGFVSRLNNECARAVGIRAAKLVWENLPEFCYNPLNDRAAEAMAWAQYLGALTYAMGGGSGPIHSMAHQISAVSNLHHGLGNAIMMIPMMEFNYRAVPEAYGEMARTVYDIDTRNMNRVEAAEAFIEKTEAFRNLVGITPDDIKLSKYGIGEDDLDHMAAHALLDMCSEASARDLQIEDALGIYRRLL